MGEFLGKMHALEKEEALLKVRKLYGASKRRTTDAQLHKARKRVFVELERELR